MAMNQPVPPKAESQAQLAEVTGIFANSIYTGALPQEDLTYVAQLVSQNTGISQQEAEQRVQAVYDKAQANLKEAKIKHSRPQMLPEKPRATLPCGHLFLC